MMRSSLACICIVLEHLELMRTRNQWSAFAQQLFELLCAGPWSGHQGCSNEQDQRAGAAQISHAGPCPHTGTCLSGQAKHNEILGYCCEKYTWSKMKANNWEGVEGTNAHQGRPVRPGRPRGRHEPWELVLKNPVWDHWGKGCLQIKTLGLPEVKWFTQGKVRNFKHRISLPFRVQRLWFKKWLPLWNPHFPLFWDLENRFLLDPFWFSLCLERKRQGKLVSPEPIGAYCWPPGKISLSALNQALSHPVSLKLC